MWRIVDIKHSILYSRFRHRKRRLHTCFSTQKRPRQFLAFQFFRGRFALYAFRAIHTIGNQSDHRGTGRMDRSSRSPRPVRTAPTGWSAHGSASGEIAFARTHAAADAVQAPCIRETRVWLRPAAENRAGRHPFSSDQAFRAPLKIGFRRLFASGQSPTGKIFGGCLQAATLESSCIGLLAHTLKIHPVEFLEIPFKKRDESCFATVKFAGFPLIIRIFRLIFRRARCTLFSLYVFSYSLTITDSPIPNERGG